MSSVYADVWDSAGQRHHMAVLNVSAHVVDPGDVSGRWTDAGAAGVVVQVGACRLFLSWTAANRLAGVLAEAVREGRRADL